jgi:hypothetical protein
MTVLALEATAKGFANAVKRLAVKDKDFAMELAFLHNIRSEITPKALKQITKDMFEKGGRLTEKGRQEVSRVIQENGLTKKATWDEVLQAVRERKKAIKEKLAAILLPKANISKVCKNDILEEYKKIAPNDKLISKVSKDFAKIFENINKKQA